MTPIPQIPGVYHRKVGDITVTALADGYLDGGLEVLRGLSVEDATAMLAARFRPQRRISVNAYLIRNGNRTALIETGSGTYLGGTVGWLLANLRVAGVDPAAIETVMLTHMHPDHSAGLTHRETGERFFPNAELAVHENEPRHWSDDAAMARGNEREKLMYFQCARDQMAPYKDRMKLFNKPTEIFPGVTAEPIPGHTPGHTSYRIASGGEQLLVWGDIVHIPEVQIPRPEITIAFDSDPNAAAAMRQRVFDMVATDRIPVAGMHLHYPGFGYLDRSASGYALVPEGWRFEG